MSHSIPLSLYIHIPWCIKKCPYCDFNSHPQRGDLPEQAYIKQLIADLDQQLPFIQNRILNSIFIGGGTPSLFSPESFDTLLSELKKRLQFSNHIEITLEANPGTLVPNRFAGYRDAGINRLSVGVQSFQTEKLKKLGRIHDSQQAETAIMDAKNAGFDNFNIDLMFGLPDQTVADALFDLNTALALSPTHLSWYQLTIEPNTLFHRFTPVLPDDDYRFDIQDAGQALLADNGFAQYEVSAYAKANKQCQHNLNYWQFGDYIGIGAGAHGKTTNQNTMRIQRHWRAKHPKQYMNDSILESRTIKPEELSLEFMMNALRLNQPISFELFESRTGLSRHSIEQPIKQGINQGLIHEKKEAGISLTTQGKLFLNDVLALF